MSQHFNQKSWQRGEAANRMGYNGSIIKTTIFRSNHKSHFLSVDGPMSD
jgi:hypothetical protein